MPIAYEQVLPWGRSYDEYLKMFGLGEAELATSIVGCGDGPAAFNAAMHRKGRHVVSVDPIYHFDRDRIAARIAEVTGVIIEQTYHNRHLFHWNAIRDIAALRQLRQQAMHEFLDDFSQGLPRGGMSPQNCRCCHFTTSVST